MTIHTAGTPAMSRRRFMAAATATVAGIALATPALPMANDHWFDWARAEWDRLHALADAGISDEATNAAVDAFHELSAEIAARPATCSRDMVFKAKILSYHADLDDDNRCMATAAPPMYRSLLADLEALS